MEEPISPETQYRIDRILQTVDGTVDRIRRRLRRSRKRFNNFGVNPYATPMQSTPQGQFLSSTDLTDFITSTIVARRIEAGLDTENRDVSVLCTRKEWRTFMDSGALDNFRATHFASSLGLYVEDDPEVEEVEQYFTYRTSNTGCVVSVYGSFEFCDRIVAMMLANFEESDSNLEWIYSGDGSSVSVALRKDRNPVTEMYSFLGEETLEEYYDRFMSSNASILLLIGKPGTGKTSFIRGFLQHTKSNAIVTYDPAVLAKDFVFAQFIEGDASVFIIEDADTLLRARSDGNDMMHKFLNVGDGLVTTAGKKMIFSTNLPSVRDVDPALVRPGRCFDVVNFEELKAERAESLAKKLGIQMPVVEKKTYSLAELFHTQSLAPVTHKQTANKVGFV
jgi:hypothetical protein